MKIFRNNGDIIECTVAEYVTMNQFVDTKVVHEHNINLTAPKPKGLDLPNQTVTFSTRRGGRPRIHKTLRKDGKEDGRSIMFKYLAKQAQKYRKKGLTQKQAYKKAMKDYNKQK